MGMKRLAVLVAGVYLCAMARGTVTNITDIVGVVLNDSVLEEISSTSFDTSHKTVLAFERAIREGNCTNMMACMTDRCRQDSFGCTNIAEVTNETIVGARTIMENAGQFSIDEIRNMNESNGVFSVKLRHKEQNGLICRYGYFRYSLCLENGSWKIDEWEDLLLSEYEDND